MHWPARALLTVALCVTPAISLSARAEDPVPRHCTCEAGKGACQHLLKNPKKVTLDPCWCDKCREFSRHDGKTVPFGWNVNCFASRKESLYLKRHAAAWGITCSECVQDTKSCKFNAHTCPDCDEEGVSGPLTRDYAGRIAKKTVLKRLRRERRFFPKSKTVRVLYNRDFYLVTDRTPLKVATEGGGKRMVSGHEWAHLMIERAMYAKREFSETFGGRLDITKPTGMFFPMRTRDAEAIQRAYWGNPVANIIYGGTDESSVANGFCFHGFCLSDEQFGQDGDVTLHHAMRHMIGHELMSCWVLVDGYNRALPRWVHVGAAHWLSRFQDRFREEAVACNLEGEPLVLEGKVWDVEMPKLGKATPPGAIEMLFAKTAQGQLTREDHRRAWSFFHHGLSEWREPFVNMLTALRRRTPVRESFEKHLKCTPEVFQERWIERVTGKRESIDPTWAERGQEENADPTAGDRRHLRDEKDPTALAARVRGLGTIDDPKTARVLVDLLARDSDLVRETVMVALLTIEKPAVLEAIWKHGLGHAKATCRAYVARLCSRKAAAAAIPALRRQLDDTNWLARAEAAVALGVLQDESSLERLRKMVHDPAEKTRVAAMDALGMFGERAAPAVATIAKHLTSGAWQLRVVACQTLGSIGSMEGVEPLLVRMEVETGGRVHEEVHDALTQITRDDLGRKYEHWKEWWKRRKEGAQGGLPDRPPETGGNPAERPDPDTRYAQQEYFGIELFSSRVGYVLDTSGSMNLRFTPDPAYAKKMGRRFTGGDKITICKEEVAYSLKALDPRALFTIVTFGTEVRAWKRKAVPATKKNVASAIRHLRNLTAKDETNYYDALRVMLDRGDRPDASPSFRDTPDTVTFLTDGMPTKGEITEHTALLEWYTGLNRYARVRTHVIALGNKGIEAEFLRGLAERNQGAFVWIQEER